MTSSCQHIIEISFRLHLELNFNGNGWSHVERMVVRRLNAYHKCPYAQINWDVADVDAIFLDLFGKQIPREV